MRRRVPSLQRAATAAVWGVAAALAACGETTISIQGSEPEPEPEPEVDLERGLLAYFPFDEAEPGELVLDTSGRGHHGVPSQNPPTPSPSVPPVGFDNPWSLAFDGVD